MLTTLQEEILQDKVKEIAKKSLQKGLSVEVIAEITGLSLEEIKNLESEIKS